MKTRSTMWFSQLVWSFRSLWYCPPGSVATGDEVSLSGKLHAFGLARALSSRYIRHDPRTISQRAFAITDDTAIALWASAPSNVKVWWQYHSERNDQTNCENHIVLSSLHGDLL